MGQLSVKQLETPKQKAQYTHYLIKDLEVLDLMLEKNLIEKQPIRIGAEQELCITTEDFFPNNNSIDMLETIDDNHFTTEIGKYNLEINSDPLELKNDCFWYLMYSIMGYSHGKYITHVVLTLLISSYRQIFTYLDDLL